MSVWLLAEVSEFEAEEGSTLRTERLAQREAAVKTVMSDQQSTLGIKVTLKHSFTVLTS